MSVLALLASACVPALAQAVECDAACIDYSEKGMVPDDGFNEAQHPNSRGGKEARSTPGKPDSGTGEAESPETGSEGEAEEKQVGGAGGNGGDGGNGHRSGGGSPEIGIGDAQEAGSPPAGGGGPQAQEISHAAAGSSPLLPILVAVAVLAALSIGAVIYRGRRQIPVG